MKAEDKAELLSWIVTFFIIVIGFLTMIGLMVLLEIKQEGVADNKRFAKINVKQEPFGIVVSEDIYVPEKLQGKYTKSGILILPKSERGW
jgi:hypothetical protein